MQSGQSEYQYITKYTFADGQTEGIWYDGSTFVGDNKTVLDFEDDAARANWGGKWRTPTDEEWTWLRNNCTWTWTNDYLGDGSNKAGRIVTSNVNGNVIFLPAAGGRYGDILNDAGIRGNYWSSSLNEDYSDGARRVHFESGGVRRNSFDRTGGFSVRPVSE